MLRLDINLVFTIVNLLILYVAMRKFLLKPVHDIIAERQKMVDDAFSKAKTQAQQAVADQAKLKEELAKIEEERSRVLEEAQKEADEKYQQIIEKARIEADRTIASAKENAEHDRQKLLEETAAEMSEMVLSAAAKVMAGGMTEEGEKNLYDQFISEAGEKA